VRYYGAEDTAGIYAYDTEKKAIKELLFGHKEVDAQGLLLDRQTKKLVGVRFETDRPVVYWVDPNYAKQQAAVDHALPGTINSRVDSSRDGSKVIFLAFSDRAPGTYYLLHTSSNKLEKLFDASGRIKAEQMSEMKPVQYRSRDGLAIHGYLTLPLGSSGKNLPLIVDPHGGPWVRDSWTFDPEVQFFANRGYAVLQMNFRGSSGYGKSFLRAGYRQWGRKMQDDITDGVKWAIEQGIADPKRIAIYGSSYGGYAALVGLEFTPDLYQCGVCYAGVADIAHFIKSRAEKIGLETARLFASEAVGDLKTDKAQLRDVSPQNHVNKIQVPVLLAYGELDPRTPISEGRNLARELKKQGKKFEMIVKADEGHGFHKEENKIDFYRKVDEFLKENLK
jgi:dipeptidyl aminopeptidase/acylaminoacyl peptidase